MENFRMVSAQASKKFQLLVAWLLALRFIEGLVMAFYPYPGPHFWRQTDTLSVGIRYAQRWQEGLTGWDFWLPAMLNSGETSAIMPMEFPFYNFLLGLGYLVSWENGPLYASLIAFGWSLLLWGAILWVWRNHDIWGIPAWRVWLLLPLLGQSGLYFTKLMPDFTAMAFLLLACGVVWDDEKEHPWIAGGLATLGLLIKPPVCILLALLFLKKTKWAFLRQALWIIVSLGISILYYTKGLDFIRLYTTRGEIFAVALHSPWEQWASLQTQGKEVWKWLSDGVFFPGGSLSFILCLVFTRSFPAWGWKLGLLLLLQCLAIMSLDGAHSLAHRYYYIGMSPLICLAVYTLCTTAFQVEKFPRLQQGALILFATLWVGASIDRCVNDLGPISWLKEAKLSQGPPFAQCQVLRARHPEIPWQQGVVFRSHAPGSPFLGVCFGEREHGKKGKWGFFRKEATIPSDCHEIDGTEKIRLVACD